MDETYEMRWAEKPAGGFITDETGEHITALLAEKDRIIAALSEQVTNYCEICKGSGTDAAANAKKRVAQLIDAASESQCVRAPANPPQQHKEK